VATVEETALAPWSPPDPEAIGVSRRQFFNRATVTLTSAGLGAFAAAGFVAFLWPTATGGFGQPVNIGKVDDVKDGIRDGQGFFYAPSARTWVTAYPADALPKAAAIYPESILAGMEQGLVALYQKCPHLGCRVPQCVTSQWFECPCHGSQYNQVGEKKAGPAPRGMDHFPLTVGANGDVVVNTGIIVTGAPIGTNTTGQEAEGPHCITGGGEH
jgi:cytochrome b6-f complex iron-sulfur subunit